MTLIEFIFLDFLPFAEINYSKWAGTEGELAQLYNEHLYFVEQGMLEVSRRNGGPCIILALYV